VVKTDPIPRLDIQLAEEVDAGPAQDIKVVAVDLKPLVQIGLLGNQLDAGLIDV
jgi:hypothetical protein